MYRYPWLAGAYLIGMWSELLSRELHFAHHHAACMFVGSSVFLAVVLIGRERTKAKSQIRKRRDPATGVVYWTVTLPNGEKEWFMFWEHAVWYAQDKGGKYA